jgi:hypothetical protein
MQPAVYLGFLLLSEDHDSHIVALTCKNQNCGASRTGIRGEPTHAMCRVFGRWVTPRALLIPEALPPRGVARAVREPSLHPNRVNRIPRSGR